MKTLRTLLAIAALAAPLFASAQTLPQSTTDRQEIANLTYQANLPGTSPADRAAIARRITELQYRINTNPPITPTATIAPLWTGTASFSNLPMPNPNASPIPLSPTIYGSCEADRSVIAYLTEQLSLPSLTQQERAYDASRRDELQRDLTSRGC